ncbi:MAG: F0F1 ATP synthase subunit A [Acidobacteriaceae bacterium]|nr:F0F1 ATP synthase subunit A [Acidobacteriaceae bacterium]MBV9779739.1 F0F1 ATP synthase subunit A [Acidobacteriaceae bacterium]
MHELWITRLLNSILAGPANVLLNAIHFPAQDPKNPWSDWLACEIVVVIFCVIFFAVVRRRLSVDRPGKVQHALEVVYEFLHAQAEEVVGHDGGKYMAFFGTIFFFILFMNLIGLIPGFDSPTMYPMVPFGMAVSTFIFYHAAGLKTNRFGYVKQFLGPMLWLAPLMLPIEIISHFARPLSLTVRLFANMFAGEQVYLTFISLTKLIIPAVFIGLHLFVSFLQAYIFTLLAMIYVSGAVSHEH